MLGATLVALQLPLGCIVGRALADDLENDAPPECDACGCDPCECEDDDDFDRDELGDDPEED